MAHYSYTPRGVCSEKVDFEITDGKLHNVVFTRGCNGNLKAIGKLLEGMEAARAVELLKGNVCGIRGTSCADQFAQGVEKALQEEA